MDDLFIYTRLALHLLTALFLLSYKCDETSRPIVSMLAAFIAGASLSASAHILLMGPTGNQVVALIITALLCVPIVRHKGNLAKALKLKGL